MITTIVQILYLDSPAVDANNSENLYRIGTVASLTGISVERLRAWERRYDLTPAHKSGKTRFYSKAQLDRLRLIKHLIDLGQPISSLATLNTQQLKARIEDQAPQINRLEVVRRPTVGLAGPNLIMLENQTTDESRLDVNHRWANFEALQSDASVTEPPQILIVQLPVLKSQPIDFITENYPDTRIVTLYQFATEHTLAQLNESGIATLRWPVSWAEIEHIAISELGYSDRVRPSAPRRFSDEELIALAATLDDGTNCPQYLIEAINQLNALSSFVQDTAHSADRPSLYKKLLLDAEQARAQLELGLDELLQELLPEANL